MAAPARSLLLLAAAALLVRVLLRRRRHGQVKHRWRYADVAKALSAAGERLPCMVVHADAFDANVKRLAAHARQNGKNLRLATKSVRVVDLLRRAHALAPDVMKGLMCFSVAEAAMLADQGFDDLLVAYPAVQRADVEDAARILRTGKTVVLMVDSPEHMELLSDHVAAVRKPGEDWRLPLCIDVDCSLRVLRGAVSLGAHRSCVHSAADAAALARASLSMNSTLFIDGVMAYEAQVAGMPDRWPGRALLNPVIRLMKRLSMADLGVRRAEIHAAVARELGAPPRFFNAGGTGNLAQAAAEGPHLSEVTCGSGMLQSHLFDNFESSANEPAVAYALPVTRKRGDGIVVCQSGGFVGSGDPCPDKWPVVFMPAGLGAVSGEGFGEVQTPLTGAGASGLRLGDPVFCRPAKAGEIMEHFTTVALVGGETSAVQSKMQTYRGAGHVFY
eukprot:TRINITY_DN15692_c0_g1_i1.p1 TRINITY_DN15692_c0_g1~~TRINITY_DN15692_c0_g1_i1.p1  ORF type:complete len:459 (+),score=150.50 TRINITY_DN15692_c0_g1_i1:45-1379(+)